MINRELREDIINLGDTYKTRAREIFKELDRSRVILVIGVALGIAEVILYWVLAYFKLKEAGYAFMFRDIITAVTYKFLYFFFNLHLLNVMVFLGVPKYIYREVTENMQLSDCKRVKVNYKSLVPLNIEDLEKEKVEGLEEIKQLRSKLDQNNTFIRRQLKFIKIFGLLNVFIFLFPLLITPPTLDWIGFMVECRIGY